MGDLSGDLGSVSQALDAYLNPGGVSAHGLQEAQTTAQLGKREATMTSEMKTRDQNQSDINIQEYQKKKEIDKDNQDDEPTMSPNMAENILPGAGGTMVTNFQKQNGRLPTMSEAKDFLQQALDQIKVANPPASKIRHYLGNDPDGNAIFAGNDGTMYSPDGSKYDGKVLPKNSNQPTAQTRASAEFATTILPHITEMRDLIKQADAKGYIGPASGRIYNQFMAGKVGSTGNNDADQLLGRLRAMDSLLKTGAMKVHFGSRGGANMYEHFSDMLNTGKQSSAMLNGSLDTMEEFMRGYAGASAAGNSKTKADDNDPLGILK